MCESYNIILDLIKKYDTITIFRHIHPDGDAVGSQLGLLIYLKENFPEKRVYALGKEIYDTYPFVDEVDDEVIKESLAIVLDTSNRERIDDDRWSLAQESIKIDHHPAVDHFANHNFVKESAGALCEFLTEILLSFEGLNLSKAAATYLYSGLLTDTLKFATSSTSANTLSIASKLCETGIDIYKINDTLFSKDFNTYNFTSYLRSKLVYSDHVAYAIITSEDLEKCNMQATDAKPRVSDLGGVKEFKVWCQFTQMPNGTYDASLRSKRGYIVNDIAAKFNGGGHNNASGIKNLTLENIYEIIELLKERVREVDL